MSDEEVLQLAAAALAARRAAKSAERRCETLSDELSRERSSLHVLLNQSSDAASALLDLIAEEADRL